MLFFAGIRAETIFDFPGNAGELPCVLMPSVILLSEAEKAARGEGFALFEEAVRACLDNYMEGARYACFGENVLIRYLYQLEEQNT